MIRPLGNRIIVQPPTIEETIKNGIIIPIQARERPQMGKVISIGADCKTLKVGETILYGKYAGSEIVIEDKNYLIMHEEDVLGVDG